MVPQSQRWAALDILRWAVVGLGVFWFVCGLIAILAPWWIAKKAVSAALGLMFSLMNTIGYVFILSDDGNGVFILDWLYGRLNCPAYCFGLGMMGCGLIAALTPNVLIRRLQNNAIHQLSQPE